MALWRLLHGLQGIALSGGLFANRSVRQVGVVSKYRNPWEEPRPGFEGRKPKAGGEQRNCGPEGYDHRYAERTGMRGNQTHEPCEERRRRVPRRRG